MSRKLTGIRLVPIELEIGRKPAAKGAQTLQQFSTTGLARHTKLLAVGDMDFNLVALLQAEHFDHSGREPDSKAASHLTTCMGLPPNDCTPVRS